MEAKDFEVIMKESENVHVEDDIHVMMKAVKFSFEVSDSLIFHKESFKIKPEELEFNEDSDDYFSKIFSFDLQAWAFKMEVWINYNGNKKEEKPSLKLRLIAIHQEEGDDIKLNELPLISFCQNSDKRDFFYEFGQNINSILPQTTQISLKNSVSFTVKRLPNVESSNGRLELEENVNIFDSSEFVDASIHYFLTSEKGYLVRLELYSDDSSDGNLKAKITFIAGPNDKNLTKNFPHILYCMIKDQWNDEPGFYSEPVIEDLADNTSYTYTVISWSDLYDRKLVFNDFFKLRFEIIGII